MYNMTHAQHNIVRTAAATLVVALALVGVGCDSTGTSPDDTARAPVTVSFVATTGSAAGTANTTAKAAKSRTFADDAGNELTLDAVELIVSEFEFERADADAACRDDDDDDCEEIEDGPILVGVPMDTDQPAVVLESTLPEGLWEEIEFEIDKLERDDDDETALLDETGFPENVSIRVTGTWTLADGTSETFTYQSDLEAEQELEFEPPIEVTANASKNVTLALNIDRWFRTGDGLLVNPAGGNEDGAYEDLIEDNIEEAIEGFKDDDLDGDEDDDDD